MKVWFKRVLAGVVVIVIAALVGLAVFLLTFDPNAYKSKLEDIVYNRYHRTLGIKGDIQLSLFPRIGLSVQDVSLSDRDSSDTFASIDSARFAVAIWPLLFDRLVVDHVAVTGFKAWVTRDGDGRFNFRDLMDGGMADNDSPAGRRTVDSPWLSASFAGEAGQPPGLGDGGASRTDFQIDIAGLDLKNGEIHFFDVKTGAISRVVKLDVNTGRMTFDQPFDVALTGRLIGDYPVAQANIEGQALVKMNPETQTYSAQKLNVQLSGLLGTLQAKSATLRGSLAYSGYSQMVSASNLELLVQGAVQGENPIKDLEASLSVPQLKIDRSQSEFKLEKLALRAKGAWPSQGFNIALDAPSLSISPDSASGDAVSGTIKLSGSRVLGVALGMSGLGGNAQNLTLKELKLAGTLKQQDRAVQFNVSSPAAWNVLQEQGGLSAIKGDVKIEDTALPGGSFEFPLIGSLQADLVKDEMGSEINAILSGSKLDFSVKATQLANPKVVFNLEADTLDFNKMFPPAQAPAPPAPAAAKAEGEKPAAAPKPAPKEAAKAPEPLDLRFLNSVDIQGKVKLDGIKVREFQAEHINAEVRAAQGKLEISKVAADLYQGKLRGQFTANADNELASQFTLERVALGDLWQSLARTQRISGVGILKFDLNTQGATPAALVAGLTGSVQAQVRDGALSGLDISQTLREVAGVVRNVFSGQVPDVASNFEAGRKTEFASLDARVKIVAGQGTVEKLDVTAPLLRISEGTPASIDLVNGQLDVTLNARVVNIAGLSGGSDLSDLRGVTIPVRLSGPFNAITYKVQWTEIGSQAVKQALQDGLLDLLSNQVTKEFMPRAAQEEPATPAPEKPDPVKSIGKALKGLLGQ